LTLPIGEPKRRFYSQRIDGKPYVNCLPYSICPVLAWMGYVVPDDYGMTIREASGVPVADHRGTSHADMKRALKRLLPTAPVVFAPKTDSELINLLTGPNKPNRRNVVSINCRMERLPRNLRRHVGYDWVGLHALTLHGRQKAPDGTWLVYLSDPMGRTYRGYAGEWVRFGDIQSAIKREANGLIPLVYGERGTAQ
jgi:hypothetical protein